MDIERIARAAYEHPAWGHKQPWEKNPWAREAWVKCMTDVLALPACDECGTPAKPARLQEHTKDCSRGKPPPWTFDETEE